MCFSHAFNEARVDHVPLQKYSEAQTVRESACLCAVNSGNRCSVSVSDFDLSFFVFFLMQQINLQMDRASILGDAIDYLKELLQRISDIHNELEATPAGPLLHPSTSFNPLTPTPPTLPYRIKEEICASSAPSPKNQPARVHVYAYFRALSFLLCVFWVLTSNSCNQLRNYI